MGLATRLSKAEIKAHIDSTLYKVQIILGLDVKWIAGKTTIYKKDKQSCVWLCVALNPIKIGFLFVGMLLLQGVFCDCRAPKKYRKVNMGQVRCIRDDLCQYQFAFFLFCVGQTICPMLMPFDRIQNEKTPTINFLIYFQ